MKIDILLATYNGAKYLKSQLLSILSQTHEDWSLIVHDDGSVDETIDIIETFVRMDPRIKLIRDNKTRLGPAANFIHLLQYSDSDLIIFCDQDDIWFEDKLSQLHRVHLKSGLPGPLAVYCNGYAYSKERGIISNSITEAYPKKLEDQLFLNAGIQGCSLMFNKSLKERLTKIPEYVVMHDHFITLGAICFGKLYFYNEPLMFYRQDHENKVTSNIEISVSRKFKAIFISNIPVVDRKHFEATRSFYQAYSEKFTLLQQKLFKGYFTYCEEKSLFKRLYIIATYRFNIYNSIFLLMVKTITRKAIN